MLLKHGIPLSAWVSIVDFSLLVSLWKRENVNLPIKCKQRIPTHHEYCKFDWSFFFCVRFCDGTSNLKLTVCVWKSHTKEAEHASFTMRIQQKMAYPLHIVRWSGGSTSGPRKWSTRPWHLLHSCATLISSRGEALGPPPLPRQPHLHGSASVSRVCIIQCLQYYQVLLPPMGILIERLFRPGSMTVPGVSGRSQATELIKSRMTRQLKTALLKKMTATCAAEVLWLGDSAGHAPIMLKSI